MSKLVLLTAHHSVAHCYKECMSKEDAIEVEAIARRLGRAPKS
jgi:hypothetical protein